MQRNSEKTNVIVERTIDGRPLDSQDCRHLAEIVSCFEIYDVHFVESFLSEQRNRLICHFEAPDAESVRQALRGADLDFDSIWTAKITRRHQHA